MGTLSILLANLFHGRCGNKTFGKVANVSREDTCWKRTPEISRPRFELGRHSSVITRRDRDFD